MNWARNFSFKDVNRAVLAAVALLLTAAVVAATFAVGTLGLLHHRYDMSGVFADTGGLGKGDPVRVAGVQVGVVTGIHPDFALGQVIITWNVDRGVNLGPETSAEVELATLLGGHDLHLSGPVVRPYVAGLPATERRIPLARTSTSASVNDALNDTTRAVQRLDVTDLNTLVSQLATVTSDNRGTVATLLHSLAAVSGAINQREGDLRQLVSNTQAISATLAAKDQALVQLVDTAGTLLREIVARRNELATLLGTGSQAVSSLSALVDSHQAELSSILSSLHTAIDAAKSQLPQVDTSLAFIGPAFAGVASIGRQGPWVDAVTYGLPAVDVINLLKRAAGQ